MIAAIDFLDYMLKEGWSNYECQLYRDVTDYPTATNFVKEMLGGNNVTFHPSYMKGETENKYNPHASYAAVWMKSDKYDYYDDLLSTADMIANTEYDENIYIFEIK